MRIGNSRLPRNTANGNQVGRVSGKVFQMSQYLLIWVNLSIKPTLVLYKRFDLIECFQ